MKERRRGRESRREGREGREVEQEEGRLECQAQVPRPRFTDPKEPQFSS